MAALWLGRHLLTRWHWPGHGFYFTQPDLKKKMKMTDRSIQPKLGSRKKVWGKREHGGHDRPTNTSSSLKICVYQPNNHVFKSPSRCGFYKISDQSSKGYQEVSWEVNLASLILTTLPIESVYPLGHRKGKNHLMTSSSNFFYCLFSKSNRFCSRT